MELGAHSSREEVCANLTEGGSLGEGLVPELVEYNVDPDIQDIVDGSVGGTTDVISGLGAVPEFGQREGAAGLDGCLETCRRCGLRLRYPRQKEKC